MAHPFRTTLRLKHIVGEAAKIFLQERCFRRVLPATAAGSFDFHTYRR